MERDLNRRTLLGFGLSASAIAVGASLQASENGSGQGLATQWPSWRGINRDGLIANSQWPTTFKSLEKLWSKPFSDSYSGPIIADNKLFTTETVDQRDETLVALDTSTGKQVWRREWAGAMTVPPFAARNGSWIRSTPATDGKHVVLGGMRDVVACFDAETGRDVWRVDFVKQFGSALPSFGLVCSPLIDGSHVYVQAGGAVRKMRMSDGETIWSALKDGGGMYGGAFSSPIIATIHNVRQLVVQTRTTLAGVDLESGNVLWKKDIASFRGMNILTPTVWKDRVFTSSYGGRAQLLELDPASNWSVTTKWETKTEAYMSSPVVAKDHLYIHLKNKRAACVDLETGSETWRTTPFGAYWSMVTNGSKILALDESGELLLIEANPASFTLLDRKRISQEPSWAHVALVGNRIFIRRQRGLDAFEWKA